MSAPTTGTRRSIRRHLMAGGALVILLAGGTKQRQSSDIAVAKMLWKQYKQGKRS